MDNSNGQEKEHFILPEEELMVSSVNDIKEFMNSRVWKDMQMILRTHKEYLYKRLLRTTEMHDVAGIQYSLIEMEEMLNLPNRLIACVEEQAEMLTRQQEQREQK